MTDMTQYSLAVKSYAERGEDYLFHNEGNEHALIILSNIFANAKSHIRIAANMLYNDEVVNTEEYVGKLKSFLDKSDTRLSIIVSKVPDISDVRSRSRKGTLYWMLYNHPAYRQNRVVIKDACGKAFHDEKNNIVNFCTGDTSMYRLEEDIQIRKAIANFGDEKHTKQLIDAFENALVGLKDVNLAEYYPAN